MTNRLMRYPEVVEATGLSKSTIQRMEKTGCFPKRVQIGVRSVGFYKEDVEAFISSLSLAEGVPHDSE